MYTCKLTVSETEGVRDAPNTERYWKMRGQRAKALQRASAGTRGVGGGSPPRRGRGGRRRLQRRRERPVLRVGDDGQRGAAHEQARGEDPRDGRHLGLDALVLRF